MRRSFLILTILLTNLMAYSQWKVAIIDDSLPFVQVWLRADFEMGTNPDYRLFPGELFICNDSSNKKWEGWYEIDIIRVDSTSSSMKPIQIHGFVEQSEVMLIEDLPMLQQRAIIRRNMQTQNQLATDFRRAYLFVKKSKVEGKDSAKYHQQYLLARRRLENNYNYDAILRVLPGYFCGAKDPAIISLFMEVMWSDRGSANEMPSYTIAECYLCAPDMVIAAIQGLSSEEHKKLIVNQIDWGLQNILYWKDEDIKKDPRYIEGMKKLESVWN